MNFMIISRNAEDVIEKMKKTGRFDSGRHRILKPIPIDSVDLIIQTIIQEKPDFIVLGFNLGNPMFNGCQLASLINQRTQSYIIASYEDVDEFYDVKYIVDKIVRCDTQEYAKAFESLIPCF